MSNEALRWAMIGLLTGFLLGFLAGAHEGAKRERVLIEMRSR